MTENAQVAIMLQLGHGDEAVETTQAKCRCNPLLLLQLGHGDEAVETAPRRKMYTGIQNASIGPRR